MNTELVDLPTIEAILDVRTREELAAAYDGTPSTAVLAGGTWLFSTPQVNLRTLVDLGALRWEPVTVSGAGLRISATCPIAALADIPTQPGWAAQPLLRQCVRALLASFKVRSVATVGGNICLALPAGSMTSLAVGLDAVAEIWGPDTSRQLPVQELVTGDRQTALRPGEVLRAINIGVSALRARTAFRRTSLSRLGRSASLLIGRRDRDGGLVLAVTASTPRPIVLRYPQLPSVGGLVADVGHEVETTCGWFDDVHGAPDWRRATTLRSAAEICEELS